MALLVTAACGTEQVEPANESLDCLNTIDGSGDLEITETVMTPMDDNRATYAVEITNNSKTDTAMLSTIRITLLDSDGEPLKQKSDHAPAEDHGVFEYIAPGKSKYWAGTWPEELTDTPADMKVDFPKLKHPKVDGKTFWWPHEDVTYSHPLTAEVTSFEEKKNSPPELSFTAHNDSKIHYPYATVLVVFKDKNGNLLGGQEVGPGAQHSSQNIDIGPGETEYTVEAALPEDTPSSAEPEIQVTNSPEWREVAPNCPFAYDAPQPA